MGVSLVIIKSDGKMVGGKKVCPLYLQYKYKGSYKRFPTHQFIEERFWKSGVISNRCPKYNDISKRISSVRSKLEEVVSSPLFRASQT